MGRGEKSRLREIYLEPPRDFSYQYPLAPAPDDPLALEILAARWACGDLFPEDFPRLAVELLDKGHDSSSLRKLSGTNATNISEVETLVNAMFRELGLWDPLTERQAKLITSRQIAREVIAGTRNPWAAANHLEIVVWSWKAENPELDLIFRINDEIDWDIPYRRPLEELEENLLGAFSRLATISIVTRQSRLSYSHSS